MSYEIHLEIPQTLFRALVDKTSEKKKSNIKAIENFIRQSIEIKNEGNLKTFLKLYKKQLFDSNYSSQNTVMKRASLVGYGIIANLLKPNYESVSKDIFEQIMYPINQSAMDSNNLVAITAGESLYNLIRCMKPEYSIYFFDRIFEVVIHLMSSPDQETRSLAQTIDELLKQIVNVSFSSSRPQGPLISKLNEKFDKKDPNIKIYLLSWITYLSTIPDLDFINEIPTFLPKVFDLLKDNNKDVYFSAEKCLRTLLKEVDLNYHNLRADSEINILDKINDNAKSSHFQMKYTSFIWLVTFLKKYTSPISVANIPFNCDYAEAGIASITSANSMASLVSSTSISVSQTSKDLKDIEKKNSVIDLKQAEILVKESRDVKEFNKNDKEQTSKVFSSNTNLTRVLSVEAGAGAGAGKSIPYMTFPNILYTLLWNINRQNENLESDLTNSFDILVKECEEIFSKIVQIHSSNGIYFVKSFEETLYEFLDEDDDNTMISILNWLKLILKCFKGEFFNRFNEFILKFKNLITSNNQVIFELVINNFCEIAKEKEQYVDVIFKGILEKLCSNESFLRNKGLVILKKLCLYLPVNRIYSIIAKILLGMKKHEFIGSMINILDIFLLTYPESVEFRVSLKKLEECDGIGKLSRSAGFEKSIDKRSIFSSAFYKLYQTWCFNPVSALILCIISEQFDLAYLLVFRLGELKLNQDHYIQLAKLVQLFESPIFLNIRVLLLEPKKNVYLVKTLYGILLLLPQGNTYSVLEKRLNPLNMLYELDETVVPFNDSKREKILKQMLEIFDNVQKRN